MIKKLKIEEKAAWSDLQSDQVCILTCESVILSRACALGRYFLGNGVTIASKDGWCVCVCGLESVCEQKAMYKGIITKEKAGSCSKETKTCSETGSRTSFLCCDDINVCPRLLFTPKVLVDKRKEFLLVGAYSKPYFLYS